MSATVLSFGDGSWLAHGWLSAVIDVCPHGGASYATCYAWILICVPLKSIAYSRDHSECCGIKGAIICPFINLKVDVMEVVRS